MTGDGATRAEGESRPSDLERPVPADWLAARRRADERARTAAAPLIRALGQRLGSGPVTVFDLGAGTGANQAYLGPRLPFESSWVLLDHDAALLDAPGQGPGRRVLAGVEEMSALIAEAPAPQLVTCSALLDLLTRGQLDLLVTTLAGTGTPALLSLTVTGDVTVTPPDPDDAAVAAAFDAHQARSDRPGPGAAAYVRERANALGLDVHTAETPWKLTASGDADLLRRWLTEFAQVAQEQDPALAAVTQTWLDRRLSQLDSGGLAVAVGHEDLLVLPGHRTSG